MLNHTIRVAIADDNKDLVSVLSKSLAKNEGIEIVGTANDGLEAISVITSLKPDVVLLDIMMPHVDGIGVLERIRNMPVNKPQFIMLSAVGQYDITQIALSLGAEFFILKPFNVEDLATRIKQLYSAKQHYKNETKLPVCSDAYINKENNLDLKVKKMLGDIGLLSHLKGYQYLVSAITMVAEDFTAISSVTRLIYSGLAIEYKTTPASVERAIRNAIERTWSKGNTKMIGNLFGYDKDEGKICPSNSKFIIMAVNKIREDEQLK